MASRWEIFTLNVEQCDGQHMQELCVCRGFVLGPMRAGSVAGELDDQMTCLEARKGGVSTATSWQAVAFVKAEKKINTKPKITPLCL